MADYRNAVDLENAKNLGVGATNASAWKLAEMLQKQNALDQNQKQFEQGHQNDLDTLMKKSQLSQNDKATDYAQKQQFAQDALDQVTAANKANPGMGYSLNESGASITPRPPNLSASIQADKLEQGKMEGYSKRLEKYNGFGSSLQDLDQLTNKDGNGGVLTNPNAKLSSTGGLLSKVPDQGLGLAEMMGVAPKGSSDERKSLARVQLEYQKAMSGMRVTDQARAQEKAAMGWIASGDPDLVAKGTRALARNVGHAIQTVQSGYKQNVRDQVHSLYGDPMDQYANVYDDNAPSNRKTPSSMSSQSQSPQGMSAQQSQPSAPQQSAPGGFDPDAYLKGGK